MKFRMVFPALAGAFLFVPQAEADMQGDPEAIQMARQLVESIGGAELWANAKTFYAVEKSRSLSGDGIVGTFWRDLENPREWYRLDSRTGNIITSWWDENGVYQTVNGKPNTANLPDDIDALVRDYWPGEIYIMYARLAREDETLRLEKNEDNSFTAYDLSRGDRRLGTFWMNREGQMYRWRHDEGTEYIYGPHKEFGPISFPDWGTQVDGTWSFYYVEVRLLDTEILVSFDPPGAE